MKRTIPIFIAATIGLGSAPAFAQVHERDHRNDQTKEHAPSGAARHKRDHRGAHTRDHRGAHTRDHRGTHMRDHRGAMADHGRAMGDRDHRGAHMRDHRGAMADHGRAMGDRDHRPGAEPPPAGWHHHDWSRFRGRPAVWGYRPRIGPARSTIVIHGKGFSRDMRVFIGGRPVKVLRMTPHEIQVRPPKGLHAGVIVLKRAGHKNLFVGPFTVGKPGMAARERARREREWRARARKRWMQRKKALPRKAAKRRAEIEREIAKMRQTRAERRRAWVKMMRAKWHRDFLTQPDVQAELALHARRTARLDRMLHLAEEGGNDKLAVRIEVITDRENNRHDSRMKELKAAYASK